MVIFRFFPQFPEKSAVLNFNTRKLQNLEIGREISDGTCQRHIDDWSAFDIGEKRDDTSWPF